MPVAVVVLIIREDDGRREVLLQRRQNTGFGDGMWRVTSRMARASPWLASANAGKSSALSVVRRI